jgi:hypothetical protein
MFLTVSCFNYFAPDCHWHDISVDPRGRQTRNLGQNARANREKANKSQAPVGSGVGGEKEKKKWKEVKITIKNKPSSTIVYGTIRECGGLPSGRSVLVSARQQLPKS